MPDHAKDRAAAIQWAQQMLEQRCLLLDSETTGLGPDAEIVQLAVVNHQGVTLFDTLICPLEPSKVLRPGKGGKCAADIHGLMPEDVADAPTFRDIYPELWRVVRDRPVVIYNRDYDVPRLKYVCKLANVAMPFRTEDAHCAMLAYAAFVGDWNDYRGNYRWQPLQGGDHSALGDCRATLKLLREMANAT